MVVPGRSASEWGLVGFATVMMLIFLLDTLFRMSGALQLATVVERSRTGRICSFRCVRIVPFTDFLKIWQVSTRRICYSSLH